MNEYEAEITHVATYKTEGVRVFTVKFTRGSEVITRDLKYQIYTPEDQIHIAIKQQAEELAKGDTPVFVGALDLEVINADTPVEQKEASDWFNKKKKLIQLTELVTLGVFTEDETEIPLLRKEVRDGYKEEFHG